MWGEDKLECNTKANLGCQEAKPPTNTSLSKLENVSVDGVLMDEVRCNINPCRTIVHYCKFGNFRENFIFANSFKTHICDVENSRQGRDLPI